VTRTQPPELAGHPAAEAFALAGDVGPFAQPSVTKRAYLSIAVVYAFFFVSLV